MSLLDDIEAFQGTIRRSVESHTAPYSIMLKGKHFVLFPEVFNPVYAKAALLLLDNLGVCKGDFVLDMFTGSGCDAIFAVLEGASGAVAVDKFKMPYLCGMYNAARLGVNVDVRQGDLFDALKESEKFDLILANPPFRAMDAPNSIEASMMDPGYKTFNRFWNEVGYYLKDSGRIRMVFSNIGDIEMLQTVAKENGYSHNLVASTTFASNVLIGVWEFRK